ncbi:MAG: pyruvate dehydrogenase (acetyl-transferring) E1 component subunit alpha [Gammaproteobacteria bacterium]|nr:pyruvate dehydrogenase (acetyl-transferring) E1 component subunit alpha [Gammaproteobacteria bacterium]
MANADNNNSVPVGDSKQCVAKFEIHYSQFLNHKGETATSLPEFTTNAEEMLALYRMMVLTRTFDAKAIALQRTGKMGTYASSLGQEAVTVGIGRAMRKEDVLVPAYREYGAQFQRGVEMSDILLYWGGDERSMKFNVPSEDFPISVPIASHIPHAAGIAYAMKLRKQPRVAVAVLGDGATSKGDFYEAMNLAGAWQLPMIIVVTNNQWAISVPRKAQTNAETLAQKAIAAGIPGEQVDGNDIIAVRHRMTVALDKARQGGGATLIEAITYRMSDHTTADDASRYRSKEEVDQHRQYDPIERLRKYITQYFDWNEQQESALLAECTEKVEVAVKKYLDTPPMPPESMFDHLYATLPRAYQSQRDEVAAHKGGNDHG